MSTFAGESSGPSFWGQEEDMGAQMANYNTTDSLHTSPHSSQSHSERPSPSASYHCTDPTCADVVTCPEVAICCDEPLCDVAACDYVVCTDDTCCNDDHCEFLNDPEAELDFQAQAQYWAESQISWLRCRSMAETGYAGSTGFACNDPQCQSEAWDLTPSVRNQQYEEPVFYNSQLSNSHFSYSTLFPEEEVHHPVDLSDQQPGVESLEKQRVLTPSKSPPPIHICKWITDGECCGLRVQSDQELQMHVEKRHIEHLERENGEYGIGFYCRWSGCTRNHVSNNDAEKTSDTDETATSIPSDNSAKPVCFPSKPKVKRHVLIHTGYCPYGCRMCDMRMKTRDAIIKHERTHTGEKPYVCNLPNCNKAFSTSTECNTHQSAHLGEKPHKCPNCDSVFSDTSNLAKHKKTHFTPEFMCMECGKQMARWDQMKRHFSTSRHMKQLDTPEKLEAYKGRCHAQYVPARVVPKSRKRKRGSSSTVSEPVQAEPVVGELEA